MTTTRPVPMPRTIARVTQGNDMVQDLARVRPQRVRSLRTRKCKDKTGHGRMRSGQNQAQT